MMFRHSYPTSLRVLTGVILASSGTLLRADDVLPKAPPAAKYEKMAGHSPFAPPTVPVAAPVAAPPTPAPGWADALTATMIAQDGANFMVTVVDAQNSQQHLYLTSEPDDKAPMSVVSVKWGATHDDPPTITLRKGQEFAQVRYEAANGAGVPSPAGNIVQIPGAARNLPVPPGNAAFHSPFQASANQGPSTNAIRRPLIRAQQPAAPAGVRPGVNAPGPAGVRPNAAIKVDDDDDDDP